MASKHGHGLQFDSRARNHVRSGCGVNDMTLVVFVK